MFTIKEFCEFARISTRLFYTQQAQGVGPKVIRIGRRVLISQETGKRWLLDQEKAA